jgi:hypothetical protein
VMRAARLLFIACALGTGCLDGGGHPQVTEDSSQRPWPIVVIGGGELVLDCSDPSVAETHVLFECDSATIYSCNTLSNVVLEYETGKTQRFADLQGQVATLAARGVHDGSRIVAVRLPDDRRAVQADAAGGQRFQAPDDSCGPPPPAAAAAAPQTSPAK